MVEICQHSFYIGLRARNYCCKNSRYSSNISYQLQCLRRADNANTGNNLATKKTPATTIVAACINAETGVGPSIASGNHICNGNIALFPAPPINTNTAPMSKQKHQGKRKLWN